jgi:hypothetical protein
MRPLVVALGLILVLGGSCTNDAYQSGPNYRVCDQFEDASDGCVEPVEQVVE